MADAMSGQAQAKLPCQPGAAGACALIHRLLSAGRPGQIWIQLQGLDQLHEGIGIRLAERDETHIQTAGPLLQQGGEIVPEIEHITAFCVGTLERTAGGQITLKHRVDVFGKGCCVIEALERVGVAGIDVIQLRSDEDHNGEPVVVLFGDALQRANRLALGKPRCELFSAHQHVSVAGAHPLEVVVPKVPVAMRDRMAE